MEKKTNELYELLETIGNVKKAWKISTALDIMKILFLHVPTILPFGRSAVQKDCFSIGTLESIVKFVLEHAGKWIKYLWDISDKKLIALVIYIILNYILDVKCTASGKKISKGILFKGLCKKLFRILIIV